jgi:tetratricopeptide (TPR) repeat protein
MANQKAKTARKLDRELLVLLPLFAVFWIAVGTIGYNAIPALSCLGNFQSDGRAMCKHALERRLMPSSVKSQLRIKLIEAYGAQSEFDRVLQYTAEEEKESGPTAWLLSRRAEAFSGTDKLDEAAASYRAALQLDPANESAATALLSVHISRSTYDEAREDARMFEENNPKSWNMMSWRGWIENQTGNADLAIGHYQRAIAAKPDEAYLYRDVANIQFSSGKIDDAIASISKSIEFAPERYEYLTARAGYYEELLDFKNAQADYEKALTLERYSSTLISLGRSYTDSGDYEKALPVLDEAISQYADDEWAHSSKIRMYFLQGNYDEAKTAIDALRKVMTDSSEADYWQASIYQELGKLEDAKKSFEAVLAKAPFHNNASIDLGNVLFDLNRVPESITQYTKAIALNPQFDRGYVARSRAHIMLENWWAAISDANQAIKLKPHSGVAYARRAFAQARLGKTEEAKASYEKATTNEPREEWLWREQIDFLIAENKLDAAKNAFEAYRVASPEGTHLAELANILRQRGIALP